MFQPSFKAFVSIEAQINRLEKTRGLFSTCNYKIKSMAVVGLAIYSTLLSAGTNLESVGRNGTSMSSDMQYKGTAPIISDLGAAFTDATPVSALHCNTAPANAAEQWISPQNGVCDAPIVFVTKAIDQFATTLAERCVSTLYSKLPGYVTDLKVLGSLATGNPVAILMALGATVEGDLQSCGLDSVMVSLPVSAAVRTDLQNVYGAMKTTQDYLSLKDSMSKVLQYKDQPIDAAGLVSDVRDSVQNRREVEGLGKEIAALGKSLAGQFKDAAKNVAALDQGVVGLQNLLNIAYQAMLGLEPEALAEQVRDASRINTAECRIESADLKLVNAEQHALSAIHQSRQALANARELRVCTAELIQVETGGSPQWLRRAEFINSQGLHQKIRQFHHLADEIKDLESDIKRQKVLFHNIGSQCQILHAESQRIKRDLDNYSEVVQSIEMKLSNPVVCDIGNIMRRVDYLKALENDRCSWRLPSLPNGELMSHALTKKALTRKRNLDVELQLFDTLKAETIAAIDQGDFDQAKLSLDSMTTMASSECIDRAEVDVLRDKLVVAQGFDDTGWGDGGYEKVSPAEQYVDPIIDANAACDFQRALELADRALEADPEHDWLRQNYQTIDELAKREQAYLNAIEAAISNLEQGKINACVDSLKTAMQNASTQCKQDEMVNAILDDAKKIAELERQDAIEEARIEGERNANRRDRQRAAYERRSAERKRSAQALQGSLMGVLGVVNQTRMSSNSSPNSSSQDDYFNRVAKENERKYGDLMDKYHRSHNTYKVPAKGTLLPSSGSGTVDAGWMNKPIQKTPAASPATNDAGWNAGPLGPPTGGSECSGPSGWCDQ